MSAVIHKNACKKVSFTTNEICFSLATWNLDILHVVVHTDAVVLICLPW